MFLENHLVLQVCEHLLLHSSSFVFLATHFTLMTRYYATLHIEWETFPELIFILILSGWGIIDIDYI